MKPTLIWMTGVMLCAWSVPLSAQNFAAAVKADYAGAPGATIEGLPVFATIAAALSWAPPQSSVPCRILILPGRYDERIVINKPNIHLIAQERSTTLISGAACSDTPDAMGHPLTTWHCATLLIAAPGFRAENLTIENRFDYPANARKPEGDPSRVKNAQAVALMLSVGSDRAVFRNCIIAGYQDTLFPNAGRSFFSHCRILGHVDFIFGAGQAVFSECEIVSRDRPGKNPTGYITAPSTRSYHPYGFLFTRCRLLKETPELPAGSVRLGRPWHPGADPQASGSAVFIDCFMDDHIGAEGYAPISGADSSGRRIIYEVTGESRFFEYKSHGPGALRTPQRPVLPDEAAPYYTPAQVLADWRP